jgi:lycopene beta-cyclase
MPPKYNYIITGAGCAGLSLLMHFIQSGKFRDKKILLIDQAPKTSNDRTWCFWETGEGLFQSIVHKQWNKVWFHSDGFSRLLNISPYTYKMVRGIDFYQYCFQQISQQENITVKYAAVDSINYDETSVTCGNENFYADFIFNSILLEPPKLKTGQFYLKQHFRGWMIETAEAAFQESEATLMDFRVSQQHGTTFTYILPVSPTKAMVEYTLFTKELLQPAEYDEGLSSYITQFISGMPYQVLEVETGVIPMTNYEFTARKKNVVNIGSAGGLTKPSSGYTFYFIQQHSRALANALILTGKPFIAPLYSQRFRYYDSVLLNVLSTGKLPGSKVFTDMFRRNKPTDILKFLNNESSLGSDLRIISSLPVRPFMLAGIQQI